MQGPWMTMVKPVKFEANESYVASNVESEGVPPNALIMILRFSVF